MIISMFAKSDISNNPQDWYRVTDRVMGGKSNLRVEFIEETFVLRGNVTTQNNGGFVRLVQDIKLNDDALSGISFLAKGNDETVSIKEQKRSWLAMYTYNSVEGAYFDDNPSIYLGNY